MLGGVERRVLTRDLGGEPLPEKRPTPLFVGEAGLAGCGRSHAGRERRVVAGEAGTRRALGREPRRRERMEGGLMDDREVRAQIGRASCRER